MLKRGSGNLTGFFSGNCGFTMKGLENHNMVGKYKKKLNPLI